MPYLTKRIFIKEDPSVAWELENPNFYNHVKEHYIDTNKVSDFRKIKVLNEEGTLMEISSVWASEEIYNEFCQDNILIEERAAALAYNIANNISLLEMTEESVV
jgi:hypothetical protein